TDQWGLTGGLRWYKFDEDKLLNFHGVFTSDTPAGGVPSSVSSNGVSPRVILSYKVNDDAQFNLQASRGFRLGGINDPINTGLPGCGGLAGNQYWSDEKLWNYEIGSKLRFLDRRVTFNVAAFYEDIKNLQATVTVQYVGSSFSQFENEQPNFGVINPTGAPNFAAALIPYGAPPAGTTYTINPELSSYSLGNIRAGVRSDRWEGALYINNIWDETTRLALDYERGRRARYSYLTNLPRTIGVYGAYHF